MTSRDPLHLILIQEDEADRRLAEVVLASSIPDCRVTAVGDGNGLFRAAASGPCDAVITQLGVEQAQWDFLLKTLRALLPEAPLIVLAAVEQEAVARAAVELGVADGYVVKSSRGFLDLAGTVSGAVAASHATSEPIPEVAEPEAMAEPESTESQWPLSPPPEPRAERPEPAERAPGLIDGPPSLESLDRPDRPEPLDEPEPLETARTEPAPLEPAPPEPAFPELAPPELAPPELAPPELASIEPAPPEPPSPELASPELASPVAAGTTPVPVAPIEPIVEEVPAREETEGGGTSWLQRARIPLLAVAALVALFLVLASLPSDEGGETVEPVVTSDEALASAEAVEAALAPEPAEATAAPVRVETPPPSSAIDSSPITLELYAFDDVWVALDMDGEPVLDAILSDGQTFTFEGQESAYLQVGNAAGLTVIWNGTELGSLGRQGQVRRLQFSPEAVRPGSPRVAAAIDPAP